MEITCLGATQLRSSGRIVGVEWSEDGLFREEQREGEDEDEWEGGEEWGKGGQRVIDRKRRDRKTEW